ncbi:MAG: alpha/beta fold hydrolase [Ignavibacteria bacterium]|nr:alpha/beta fold hydrolase [Ignavibacteria bacterium]
MKLLTLSLAVLIFTSLTGCTKDRNELSRLQDSEDNKTSQVSNVKSNNTPPVVITEDFTVTTSDNKETSGSLYFSESKKDESQPLVILVHQFNQSRAEWQQSFIDSLLGSGFKVLAFDIRGHGKSSRQNGKLEDILTDPEQAPLDIKAVTDWAKKRQGIDSSRIAVIGTSIGGNLALYAALNCGVKVPVAVSNGKQSFEAFTSYNEMMMGRPYFPKMKNALLICSSKDGDHEAGQKWIYDNFCGDPKEMKVYDSPKHGKFLLEEKPEAKDLILNWLKKYL